MQSTQLDKFFTDFKDEIFKKFDSFEKDLKEFKGDVKDLKKDVQSIERKTGHLFESDIRLQVKKMFGSRASNPFTCRNPYDCIALVLPRNESHSFEHVQKMGVLVWRFLVDQNRVEQYLRFVMEVSVTWLGQPLADDENWCDSSVPHTHRIARVGNVIGQCSDGRKYQKLASIKPILEKIKYYFTNAGTMESIMNCSGIGLSMLTSMTAERDYLLEQAAKNSGSLKACRLLEELQIDCRGHVNVHQGIAVIHTGEIKMNHGNGAEQLFIASGVKALICHALDERTRKFVIKMDVFRSVVASTSGGERGEKVQQLDSNFLKLPHGVADEISVSLYEHLL